MANHRSSSKPYPPFQRARPSGHNTLSVRKTQHVIRNSHFKDTACPSGVCGTDKPCAHDGKQRATAGASGQLWACCLTHLNVNSIRRLPNPGSVRCRSPSCANPSVTHRSQWESTKSSSTQKRTRPTRFPSKKSTGTQAERHDPLRIARCSKQWLVTAVPSDL